MHSYSNKYSQIYQSDEAFEEDFERLRDELHQVTGVNSIYYRFPVEAVIRSVTYQ